MRRLLRKFKKIIEKNVLPETRPYASLDVLIARAEHRFQQMSAIEFPPLCPPCKVNDGLSSCLYLRHSNIAGGGYSGTPVGSPIRDDQGYKCPRCFHTLHFGIPISKEDAEIEVRLRGGTVLSRPSHRMDEAGREDVKRRLKELGYFDFGD